MKCHRILTPVLLAMTSLITSLEALAASIGFEPMAASVRQGDTVEVMLVGRDFSVGTGGTVGGGVSVRWDPSLLTLEAHDTTVFPGDLALAAANTTTVVDNVTGVLLNLSVASLFVQAQTADFDIAKLRFRALSAGTSDLTSELGYFDSGYPNIWADRDWVSPVDIEPSFLSAHLEVTPVPLPAALPLLAGSLIAWTLPRTRRLRA